MTSQYQWNKQYECTMDNNQNSFYTEYLKIEQLAPIKTSEKT